MTGPLSVVKIKKVRIDNQEVPDFLININNQSSPDSPDYSPDYLGSDRT